MKVEKTLDGVIIIMDGEGLKKSRAPGYIAVFRDGFSGEEIGITVEQIKSVRSASGGSCFGEVKINRQSAEAWNNAFNGDFIGHIERLRLHAQKFRTQKASPAINTTMQIKTPSGAIYTFPVEFRHDIERKEAISLVEAFEKFGFNLSDKKTRTILAEEARLEGFESAKSLINYMQELLSEHRKVDEILNKMSEALSENTPKNMLPITERFLNSMTESIEELKEFFKERSQTRLHGILSSIAGNSLVVRAV